MTMEASIRSVRSNEIQNDGNDVHNDLPDNVHLKEELSLLPAQYLSDDPRRPLQLIEGGTIVAKYALRPLTYSVFAILGIEMFERLAYHTLNCTQEEYLQGSYNPTWGPDLPTAEAMIFTQSSISIAYLAPFVGGIFADGLAGDYFGIITGISAFYLPGLLLIGLVNVPNLITSSTGGFNMVALKAAMLGLFPIGTGFIKALVNVFGAKQYHPILQASAISSYYTSFYVTINIGGTISSLSAPILAHKSIAGTYFIPFASMILGFGVFLLFSKRYVRRPPEKKALRSTLSLLGKRAVLCKKFDDSKKSNNGPLTDTFVDGVKRLLLVFPVTLLVVPFQLVYHQIHTAFVSQGLAMRAAGSSDTVIIDASFMSVFDNISCVLTGLFLGQVLYPALAKRNIHFPITYRYAAGSVFATLAILSSVFIDMGIKSVYNKTGEQISVFWMAIPYFLVGMGEVLTNPASLEATFRIAPKEQKGLAAAINLFMMGALPGFINNGIVVVVHGWFPVKNKSNSTLENTEVYVNSRMGDYFWILVALALLLGVGINLLPPVKNFVERVVNSAMNATRTECSQMGEDGGNNDNHVDKNEDSESGICNDDDEDR